MEKNRNHIGTAISFMQDVANEMNARFSHGSITGIDNSSMLVYPYIHINIGSVSVDKQTAQIQINIVVGDRVNTIVNDNAGINEGTLYTQYGYTENNNYGFVLQEMYVRFVMAIQKYEQLYFNELQIQRPFDMQSFIEEYDDVTAGYVVTLNLTCINPLVDNQAC